MIPIFPYYEVNDLGELRCADEASWAIPSICKRCGAYRTGECSHGKKGFCRCCRGVSLYCEDERERVYFGLRVTGFFNPSIRDIFGFCCQSLSKNDILFIVGLQDGCKEGEVWLEDMSHDKGVYANALETIRSLRCGVDWDQEQRIISLSKRGISEAMEALSEITEARNIAKQIQKKLQEYDTTCRIPQHLQSVKIFLEPYFQFVSATHPSVSKWLHDESQYRMGLTTLLNAFDKAQTLIFEVDDIHRIDAFCYAMQMLRRSSFANDDETYEIGIHRLFQRYRYCFSTPDVRWQLYRENNREFLERIHVRRGFESVPLNILDNAVKYLPEDSAHRIVHIMFSTEKEAIVITVSSYGPIRTEDEIAHIWELGNRGDANKVKAYKVPGEGLGLHKVKKIVEEHGFRIDACSKGKIIISNGLEYREFVVRLEIPVTYLIHAKAAIKYD